MLVVSTINRVNEIFENELGIHLELVNGLDLIYDDPCYRKMAFV